VKTKIKKCKYKTGQIKKKIKKQIQAAKIINNLPLPSLNEDQVNRIKKNFITTHMRSGCLPSVIDSKKMSRCFQLVSRENQSEMGYS